MSGLYPEILFHFTKTQSGIKNILKEGFRPSYAKEEIECGTDKKKFAVPMVSFCDLRLSELPPHMGKYGGYGIGLKKDWANKNLLNPVAYITKDSDFTKSLFDLMAVSYDNLFESKATPKNEQIHWNTVNTLRYIKNYKGPLTRKGKTKIYTFADEREWRYVVPFKEIDNSPLPIAGFDNTKKDYEDSEDA